MLALAFLAASCLALPVLVHAAPRTIVVPDDFPTIAAAVGNATEGDTVFVKRGTYREHSIVVNKTLTLTGEDKDNTIIENLDPPHFYQTIFSQTFTTDTYTIRLDAPDVRISGFTIIGGYAGIGGPGEGAQIIDNIITNSSGIIADGGSLTIVENKISGSIKCKGSYNNITGNNIIGSYSNDSAIMFNLCILINLWGSNNIVYRNTLIGLEFPQGFIAGDGHFNPGWSTPSGISLFSGLGNNKIAENTIQTCSEGINIDASNGNTIFRNTLNNGKTGLSIRGGGSDPINNAVGGNYFTHFSDMGIYVQAGTNSTFFANHLAENGYGFRIGAGMINYSYIAVPISVNTTFYHNNFVNNVHQAKTDYLVPCLDYFDNGKEGNYWSDYNGSDTNLDGIGDFPDIIDENGTDNHPLMTPFDISSAEVDISWTPAPATTAPTSSPTVYIMSPTNTTYYAIYNSVASVPLTYWTNASLSWAGYSLDGGGIVTAPNNGTLIEIPAESRYLTLFANDTEGNWAIPQRVYYDIAFNLGPVPEPFPGCLLRLFLWHLPLRLLWLFWFTGRNTESDSEHEENSLSNHDGFFIDFVRSAFYCECASRSCNSFICLFSAYSKSWRCCQFRCSMVGTILERK